MNTLGQTPVDIKIKNCVYPFTLKVSDELTHECILGADFLKTFNCILDYKTNTITLHYVATNRCIMKLI